LLRRDTEESETTMEKIWEVCFFGCVFEKKLNFFENCAGREIQEGEDTTWMSVTMW
jgi:hypothetical protein